LHSVKRFDGVRFVSLLKFGKALLLLATVYGAYRLLDPATGALFTQWSEAVTDRFVRHLLLKALAWVGTLNVSTIHSAAVVTFAYIALVLVEAAGLWFRKRWAEWLTVVTTSTLIPFEVWKLVFQPHGRALIILGVLIVNVAIVVYLSLQLRAASART
jgi:uncharacterized membrane protein (DUF2068 family)